MLLYIKKKKRSEYEKNVSIHSVLWEAVSSHSGENVSSV